MSVGCFVQQRLVRFEVVEEDVFDVGRERDSRADVPKDIPQQLQDAAADREARLAAICAYGDEEAGAVLFEG